MHPSPQKRWRVLCEAREGEDRIRPATRHEMIPDTVLLAESGVVRETPPMSDQPICDSQPLGLPAGKRDGQIEIGCLEMLGQGHSVTGSLRSAGGRMRPHDAGAI